MMSFHLLFMLIYLLPYKRSQYVTEVFMHLKKLLGDFEFSRLLEVILTDNGTEFSDPESIEKGSSFAGLTQEDCTFLGINNIHKLGIQQIPFDDIDLSIRLLRK